ncbi:MAG: (4Fe-4S)-binding protein [Thermodesulfatator sp.]|nr:MAG: (4Fe-4S)-binding protein [Thermodesulfatator sp.]
MKELLVISGKGGTGKTTVVASFSRLAREAVLADYDVDAPDLWILLDPEIQEERPFYGGYKPRVVADLCNGCDVCGEHCQFGAIEAGVVDYLECEGCGFCEEVCPEGAIVMEEALSGHLYLSQTPYGPFVFARLRPGEENSGKLVTEVKKEARERATQEEATLLISDGPPGIGCPVIASLNQVHLALIVTEPSLSALSDLKRTIELCRFLRIPSAVVINRFDLNPQKTEEIETFCKAQGIALLQKIPFDRRIPELLVQRKSPLEGPPEVQRPFLELWERVLALLGEALPEKEGGGEKHQHSQA